MASTYVIALLISRGCSLKSGDWKFGNQESFSLAGPLLYYVVMSAAHAFVPSYITKLWFVAGTLNCIANICNHYGCSLKSGGLKFGNQEVCSILAGPQSYYVVMYMYMYKYTVCALVPVC